MQVAIIFAVTKGYLDAVPVNKVKDYETWLYDNLQHNHAALLERLEQGYFDDSDVEALKAALNEWQG